MKNLFLLYLLCFTPFLFAQKIDISELEQIIDEHLQNHQFSGTVLIAEQGEILLQKTNGVQSLTCQTPIQDQSPFAIASITKMLTALVVLQLVEEGKINLGATLAEYLPEWELPKAKKITIHHLLLHISGLPNEPDLSYLQANAPKTMVQMALSNKGKNRFGDYNYNNIDYLLLGEIIERVSGSSWQNQIQNRIIQPLNLEQTGFLAKDQYPENFAYPFQVNEAGESKADPLFYIENFGAAASMFSTASDLLKLDQAMYQEDFLSENSRKLMFKSYPEYNYTGYSVWTYRYPFVDSQPLVMERRGGILGANVVLIRLLEKNQSIIILSNNNRFNPDSFGDANNLREALIRAICP